MICTCGHSAHDHISAARVCIGKHCECTCFEKRDDLLALWEAVA